MAKTDEDLQDLKDACYIRGRTNHIKVIIVLTDPLTADEFGFAKVIKRL
jgi:hypothetical protein